MMANVIVRARFIERIRVLAAIALSTRLRAPYTKATSLRLLMIGSH